MYGYQGNNSQTYNYQNPNGSSFGSMGQYTGPYHPYYSNATAAYNTFPSSDQPCSSLGVLPQEFSQVGNGMPRPYFYDSNASYSRSYQGLPFNQSVEIPIANSFNTCPRNCHCCESLKPKYFTPSSAIQQPVNTQSTCDSTINATYNGLRKGFNPGLWRDCNNQLPNIHESNDSTSSWQLPKCGSNCKNETCSWPLSQRQSGKFENGEHLQSNVNNTYMLPQQHQRKSLPNNQSYSGIHSNSLLPIQTTRPSPGRNEDLLGNCRVGYQYNSFPDLPKNNVEPRPYLKPSVNPIQTSTRPTCNLTGTFGGGFPYRFSSPNSKGIHESQKCAVEAPKVVTQLPSARVESFQRHLPSNNLLDGTKEISYCQPSMIPSVHSIDSSSRRAFNNPSESDSRFLLNSSASNDVLPTSRLQLPPIQSFKPTAMVLRNPSRDFNPDFSYIPPRSMHKNQHGDEFGFGDNRSNSSSADVSMRNFALMSSDRFFDNISSENMYKMPSKDENNCILTSYVSNSKFEEKHVKVKLANSLVETDNKHDPSKDMSAKPSSSSPVIGDLRHFLSTWDDGDEEDTHSVAQIVTSPNNKNDQEQYIEENIASNEFSSTVNHLQEKVSDSCKAICNNITKPVGELKEVLGRNDYKIVHSNQEFNHSLESSTFETQSYINTDILNETESIVHELSITQRTSEDLEKNVERIVTEPVINKDSDFELRSHENISSGMSQIHNNVKSHQIKGVGFNTSNEKNARNILTGLGNLNSLTENVLVKDASIDVQRSRNEAVETFNSSYDSTSQDVSLDIATCDSSVCEDPKEQSKLQSPVGDVFDINQIVCKTGYHHGSSSEAKILECVNLESQNIISKESGMENLTLSSEDSLSKSSNLLNSGNISKDTNTRIFYNLTTRVNVRLERLEVTPDSIDGRNQDSPASLMENNLPEAMQELEHQKKFTNKNVSSPIDHEASLKENIVSSITSDSKNTEVYPQSNSNIVQCKISDEKNVNHWEGINDKDNTHESGQPPKEKCLEKSQDNTNFEGGQEYSDCVQEDIKGKEEEIQSKVCDKLVKTVAECENDLIPDNSILEGHLVVKQEMRTGELNEKFDNMVKKYVSTPEFGHDKEYDDKNILGICDSEDLKENVAVGKKELPDKVRNINESRKTNSKNSLNRCIDSAPKLKSVNYKKCFKDDSVKFVTKFLKKSPYKAVLSIRKKYHTIELRNKIKVRVGMYSETNSDWKLINKCRHVKKKRPKVLPKKKNFDGRSEKSKNRDVGESNMGEGESCIGKHCFTNRANECYLEREVDENEQQHLKNNTAVEEDDSLLAINSFCMKKVKSLGEHSFEYLDNNGAVELSCEKSIEPAPFAEEGREIRLGNLDGSCVIGNVEVFMGTVEDGSSLEEEAKESSFENVLHDDTCLGDEEIGVQYWSSFELGNELGVAMEVEVGSEIDSGNDLILVHPVEKEKNHVIKSEANDSDGTVILQEETVCQEEVKMPVSQDEGSIEIGIDELDKNMKEKNLQMNHNVIKRINENECIKTGMQSIPIDLDKIKGRGFGDSNENLNSNEIFPKSENHMEKVVQIKSSSCYDVIQQKGSHHMDVDLKSNVEVLAACPKNCSNEIMDRAAEERLHYATSMHNIIDSVSSEVNCTYQDTEVVTLDSHETSHPKISKKSIGSSNSGSITSKSNKLLENCYRYNKNLINSIKSEVGLGYCEMPTHKSACEPKSKDISGCSVPVLTPKKRILDARCGINSSPNLNDKEDSFVLDDYDKEVVFSNEMTDENDKKSTNVLDDSNVGEMSIPIEDEKIAKDFNIVDTDYSDNCKTGITELNKFGCEKLYCSTKEINDVENENDLLEIEYENETAEKNKEKTENVHVCLVESIDDDYKEFLNEKTTDTKLLSRRKRHLGIENGTPSIEDVLKEDEWNPQREVLKLKTKASMKSFDSLQLQSLKPSRMGFWKNKAWPYNKKYNNHFKHRVSIRKSSKCSASTLSTSLPPTSAFPCILGLCPTPPPPLLSPLPVLTDSMLTSVSPHCNTMSSVNISQLDFSKFSSSDDPCTPEKNCSDLHTPSSSTIKQYSIDSSNIFLAQKSNISLLHLHKTSSLISPQYHSISSQEDSFLNPELYSKPSCSMQSHSETQTASNTLAIEIPSSISSEIVQHNSNSLEMNNSSLINCSLNPSQDVPLNFTCSSENTPPRVRITFKKVGIGDKKQMRIKRPIIEGFSEKQDDINKGEVKKTKNSLEYESPLPKVTIKKKTGEKGYQSFLSGFSSASPSPSSSPTISVSPTHLSTKSERPCLGTHDEMLEEDINGENMKTESSQTVSGIKCDYNSNSIQESETSNENIIPDTQKKTDSTINDDFNNGVVEKKEGSGLVFVIRGLGNKVKEFSSKDILTEQKHPSPNKTQITEKSNNILEMSECSASSGDDEWESVPWSIWQPVVKLSRSCELDALARELHSVDEDDENKAESEYFQSWKGSKKFQDSTIKPLKHYESFGNEVVSTPCHLVNAQNSGRLSNNSVKKNGECKIRFKKKIHNDGIEIDKTKSKVIKEEFKDSKTNQEEKKQKSTGTSPAITSTKKGMSQKNTESVGSLGNKEKNKRKKIQNVVEAVCSGLKTNKKPIKQTSQSDKGNNGFLEEKNHGRENLSMCTTSSKKMHVKMKVGGSEKRLWEKSRFQKCRESEENNVTLVDKIKKEDVAVYNREKTVRQKNSSSKGFSKTEVKFMNSPSKNLPFKIKEEKVDADKIGKNILTNKSSSELQKPHKKNLSKVKASHIIRPMGTEGSIGANSRGGGRHSFLCETCCRKFSSQKWLSRHCKGVSHSRVENAQRQAVQALLLLLTGNESNQLQPLTEKELSRLKNWPSHAVPSPLQLALKEFLRPA